MPSQKLYPVLAYAGRQMVSADTQAENGKYSLRNVDHSEKTLEVNKQKTVQMDKIFLHGDEFVMGTGTLFQDINRYYDSLENEVKSKVFGLVSLDKRTVKDSRGHGTWPEKALMYRAVPDVIRNGELIAYEDSWKGHKYDSAVLAAPVHVESGELAGDYYVGAIVHLFENGNNRYYTHYGTAIIDANSGNVIQTVTTDENQSPGDINRYMYNLLHGLLNVNKKYSFRASAQDAEYMRAAENGDEETAQRMVDEAAENAMDGSKIRDEAGKLLTVYHGTSERFTVFDMNKGRANMDIQGAFFSPWDVDAAGYGENVGRYYLNIKNPADESTGYKALRMFQGQNEAGKKAKEYLIKQGYDGVNNENMEYIAFFPEQIKSADPITYDGNGDIIPLSERFREENPDIRYSQRAETEETETQEALDEVTNDPELYSQMAADADIRAAWQLLMRLHRLTTQGGENALIQKGAFEKRLSDIIQKIADKTGTKYGTIKLRNALRKIYQAMEQSQYSPGEILQYARDLMKDVLDASPGVLVEQDETTKEILAGLKRRGFYLTDDQKSEIQHTFGTISRFRQKNFGTLNIAKRDAKTASLEDVWREDLAPMLPGVFAEDTSPLDMPGILDAWLEV